MIQNQTLSYRDFCHRPFPHDLKWEVSLNHVLTELVKQLGLILTALHKAKEMQRQSMYTLTTG